MTSSVTPQTQWHHKLSTVIFTDMVGEALELVILAITIFNIERYKHASEFKSILIPYKPNTQANADSSIPIHHSRHAN